MKIMDNKGFTLFEILITTTVVAIAATLGISSFILALRALGTSTDALVLQREADEILNMSLAPEIRLLEQVVTAGQREFVFRYLSPDTGTFVTRGFSFEDGQLIYYKDDEPEVIGKYVQDFLFSYRDGGNNIISMPDGYVTDPSGIEIVDVRLTIGRDRQIYQVNNSFIPIRQFI